MPDRTLSAAAAARTLNLSRPSVKLLEEAGVLHRAETGKGFDLEEVERVAAQRNRELPSLSSTSGDDRSTSNDPIVLAVPTTSEEWENSLRLSEGNDRELAMEQLVANGNSLEPGQELTGWWSISEERLADLISNGIIVGTVGGMVTEVAKVVSHAATMPWRNRKALVIQYLEGADAEPFMGFVKGMTPTGVYCRALPTHGEAN